VVSEVCSVVKNVPNSTSVRKQIYVVRLSLSGVVTEQYFVCICWRRNVHAPGYGKCVLYTLSIGVLNDSLSPEEEKSPTGCLYGQAILVCLYYLMLPHVSYDKFSCGMKR